MSYGADTVTRLTALYTWFADTVRTNSDYFNSQPFSGGGGGDNGPFVAQDPFISQPTNNPLVTDKANFAFVSLFKMVEKFEETIAQIDKLPVGALKTAAETAWDDAITEFETDVDDNLSGEGTAQDYLEKETLKAGEALTAGQAVCVVEVSKGVFKIFVANSVGLRFGFVKASYLAGADADIYYYGINDAITSTEDLNLVNALISSLVYVPSLTTPGNWIKEGNGVPAGTAEGVATYSLRWMVDGTGIREFGKPDFSSNRLGYALLADRYSSRLKQVLITGGISPLGKSNASDSATSGDGCWQDQGGEFWWEIVDGSDNVYAPAFTGVPYYSAKKFPGGVVVGGVTTPASGYYSTKEFGFVIDIKCVQNLVTGDQIVLRIGNAGQSQTYAKGDKLSLGIVAAQDITLFGGNDGDNVQTWLVTDSVDGARPPYSLDTDTPTPYDDSGEVGFLIEQGAIPFEKGDKFTFAVEGGNFRWRKTVGGVIGAWSADLDVTSAPVVLDDGLTLHWTIGSSPALFTGDLYRFVALQPYALSNVKKPDFDMWQWGVEDAAVAVFDLGTVHTVEAVGIAFHTIPTGAIVTIDGGVTDTDVWSETVAWQKDVMGKLFDIAVEARYLKITVQGGAGGGIGWLYVGPALSFSSSAQVHVNRQYQVKRSEGINPNSLYKGKAVGGEIQWPEGYLKDEDYDKLTDMLDYLKSNNDEALMLFPQFTRQNEILLATVESDEIAFNDVYSFQPNEGVSRRISCTIPLRGVAIK